MTAPSILEVFEQWQREQRQQIQKELEFKARIALAIAKRYEQVK